MGNGWRIVGIGVDIVEVDRIATALERHGSRFLRRCFLPGEVAYCQRMTNPAPHLAARFAAKEAVAKAMGTGIGTHLGWTDIEVGRTAEGQPFLMWRGRGAVLAHARGVTDAWLSLSHCRAYAVAQAVLVSAPVV